LIRIDIDKKQDV